MIIRKALKSDISYIIQLGEKLHRTELNLEPRLTFVQSEALSHYTEKINDPDSCILVVEQDSNIVGYSYSYTKPVQYFTHSPRECVIEAVYLNEEVRGTGIFEKLIQETITWARNKNVVRIKAGIYADNEVSRSAFMKQGFKEYHVTLVQEVPSND